MEHRKTCILVFHTLLLLRIADATMEFKNLTLPGQHPSPELVSQDIQRRVNVSITRREMLAYTNIDSSTSCLTGNPIDDCWRCDPNWHLNRQRLADCGIGFGQYAAGGKGGRYYIVTDSSDHDVINPRPGTLRYAVIQTEPLWIIFLTNMHIQLSQELIFNSFKTLDGRGANVHITGVTIAFNHFGKSLVQRMPRCRRGYIHVVNNVYSRWEMYAIGGSGNPTINSQGNRYTAPANRNAKEVTKRVETAQEHWKGWNWRSEGDILMNGAFFVASGEGLELKYEKAYSVEPKSAALIDQLTMNAGVLGSRSNKLGKWTGGDGGVEDDENDYGEDSDGSSKPNTMNLISSLLIALLWFMFMCSSCDPVMLL
ncbi:putative pectate lyase [Helianthus annuus]|nr:putative pectate lyase [Helianthus annuus]